jgi:hypothetical protein
MTLHGTGCITRMSAAARSAMVAGSHIPGVSPTPPGPGGGRPAVSGGGPAPDTCHDGQTRFDPRAAGASSRPATAPVVLDPAVTALAVLLGGSALPEAAPSTAQRIVAQLAQLFATTSERVSSMLAAAREAATFDAPVADAGIEVPRVEVPRQPPPPPIGPVLTLDPSLGTIVEPEPVGGAGGLGEDDEDDDPRYPTSWVPGSGALRGVRDGRWMQELVERIDALLDEVGVTRLQLLLLTVLGPLAVAFLLDVVNRIASGG